MGSVVYAYVVHDEHLSPSGTSVHPRIIPSIDFPFERDVRYGKVYEYSYRISPYNKHEETKSAVLVGSFSFVGILEFWTWS